MNNCLLETKITLIACVPLFQAINANFLQCFFNNNLFLFCIYVFFILIRFSLQTIYIYFVYKYLHDYSVQHPPLPGNSVYLAPVLDAEEYIASISIELRPFDQHFVVHLVVTDLSISTISIQMDSGHNFYGKVTVGLSV